MFSTVLSWLRSPGARGEIQFSAPTQLTHSAIDPAAPPEKAYQDVQGPTDLYIRPVKAKRMDRWLDRVVELSGSEYTYFIILLGLVVWAFLGIPYGSYSTYMIIISDAQAIIMLIFDAFLMRQQFNGHDNLLFVAGCLRSRISSHKRMIKQLVATRKLSEIDAAQFQLLLPADGTAVQLPRESWLTKLSGAVSAFFGHIATVIGFWVCMFIWLGFGPYCGWSNTWQLYINSATSALMVLLMAFLANVREQHSRYTAACLQEIWKVDSALELTLRNLSGDQTENTPIIIPERTRTPIQRAIDYYADLVGTLAGIAILAVVFLIWIACGPALHWNANWWLLIGTYAGLIGLNDGFVLRNICQVFGDFEDEQFALVDQEDQETLASIGVNNVNEERVTPQPFSYRISVRMGYICSHEYAIVTGVIFILGLIAGASALGWNETGQLLCNIPPSIIESFFTLILITGHNVGEAKRRVDLFNIHLRRLKLVAYVNSQCASDVQQITTKAKDGVVEIATDITPSS